MWSLLRIEFIMWFSVAVAVAGIKIIFIVEWIW